MTTKRQARPRLTTTVEPVVIEASAIASRRATFLEALFDACVAACEPPQQTTDDVMYPNSSTAA